MVPKKLCPRHRPLSRLTRASPRLTSRERWQIPCFRARFLRPSRCIVRNTRSLNSRTLTHFFRVAAVRWGFLTSKTLPPVGLAVWAKSLRVCSVLLTLLTLKPLVAALRLRFVRLTRCSKRLLISLTPLPLTVMRPLVSFPRKRCVAHSKPLVSVVFPVVA